MPVSGGEEPKTTHAENKRESARAPAILGIFETPFGALSEFCPYSAILSNITFSQLRYFGALFKIHVSGLAKLSSVL